MADYIDREALKEAFWDACNNCLSEDDVADLIDRMPAADVAPVVHGRWVNVLLHREKPIRMDALCTLCSNCKKESDRTAFCPHCGAKMDKDGAQK